MFWFAGGTDAEVYAKAQAAGRLNDLLTRHNPRFASIISPTLRTGVACLVVATGA